MSLALAKLRGAFNDPLLVKAGAGLALTAKARELGPRVEQALREIDSLLNEPQAFDPAQARDTLTMIVTDYIDFVVMPLLVQQVAQRAPGVTLRILGPNPRRLAEVFSSGELDLALSYFPEPPPSLRVRPLFSDRLVGIARRGHPVLKEGSNLESFCMHGHVTIEPGEATMYNALVDQALEREGKSRRVVLSKPTFLGVPFIVEQSDLLATLPEKVARRFARFLDIEVFAPSLPLRPFKIEMMWHDRTHSHPLQRWFRELVIETCSSPLVTASE